MMKNIKLLVYVSLISSIVVGLSACKNKDQKSGLQALPDLNEQARSYMTTENTKLRTGPGPQFRVLGDIPSNAKITVVGRDGEWVLIVSKKGNAPGFLEMASVKPWEAGAVAEAEKPQGENKYQTVADTPLRSGPGLQYPVVTELTKGTKITVVEQENGWLKVESKRGNKPGFVDASYARPAEN
jgi:N-acetylmuramoyl-L-alanine amidase